VVYQSYDSDDDPPPPKPLKFKQPRYNAFLDAPAPSEGEKEDQRAMENYLPKQHSKKYKRDCVPMKPWQTKSFPNCNSLHELPNVATNLDYLGAGGWRFTFAHHQLPNAVLKLFKLDEDYNYDPRSYEMHRVDALVSERLTSSPYVMDIYGYCGLSAIYERGQTTLTKVVMASFAERKTKRTKLPLSQKVWYAYHVAHAMADVHGFDYPVNNNHNSNYVVNATVAHRDIKTDNILISKEGIAKLNDFNDSVLRRWNRTSGTAACPYYSKGFPLHWGNGFKPVEMASKQYPPLDETLDVFGLGGLLYTILVGHMPYSYLPTKNERTTAMVKGILPQFPNDYSSSSAAPEIQVMVRLIEQCMALRQEDRPSAKYVMEQLEPFVVP
jgi:serine/threonine protein kinase